MTLNRKCVFYSDKIFKRYFFDSLKKFFKCFCIKFSKLNKDSFSRCKTDICSCNHFRAAFKADSAVRYSNVFSAYFINFKFQYTFKSEMARTSKLYFFVHIFSYSSAELSAALSSGFGSSGTGASVTGCISSDGSSSDDSSEESSSSFLSFLGVL